MIVADSNVIAGLWVPTPKEDLVYEVLRKEPDWVAPLLWRSEMRNVVGMYLRQEIFDLPAAIQIMQEAETFMKDRAFEINTHQVMRLVSDSTCTAYDCEFVALAKEMEVPLVTFDRQICQEFPDIAIQPEEFV